MCVVVEHPTVSDSELISEGISTERTPIPRQPTNRQINIVSWFERDTYAGMSFAVAKEEATRQRTIKGMEECSGSVFRPDLNDDDPMGPPREGEAQPLRQATQHLQDNRGVRAGLESFLNNKGYKANDNVRINQDAQAQAMVIERVEMHNREVFATEGAAAAEEEPEVENQAAREGTETTDDDGSRYPSSSDEDEDANKDDHQ